MKASLLPFALPFFLVHPLSLSLFQTLAALWLLSRLAFVHPLLLSRGWVRARPLLLRRHFGPPAASPAAAPTLADMVAVDLAHSRPGNPLIDADMVDWQKKTRARVRALACGLFQAPQRLLGQVQATWTPLLLVDQQPKLLWQLAEVEACLHLHP